MDDHVRARGATASIVGEQYETHEEKDIFLENEELKVIKTHLKLLLCKYGGIIGNKDFCKDIISFSI